MCFIISDIKNGLKTNTDALASVIETSQRHTISDIDKNTDRICEEICTWSILQSQKADELSTDVQTLKERGSYKGFVLYPSYTMNLATDRCWKEYSQESTLADSDVWLMRLAF